MPRFSFLRPQKANTQVMRAAQDQAERIIADAFRVLGRICGQLADLVEAERLSRRGYERPGKFLERLDRGDNPPPPPNG